MDRDTALALNGTAGQLMALLLMYGAQDTPALVGATAKSTRTVARSLAQLQQAGLIHRQGDLWITLSTGTEWTEIATKNDAKSVQNEADGQKTTHEIATKNDNGQILRQKTAQNLSPTYTRARAHSSSSSSSGSNTNQHGCKPPPLQPDPERKNALLAVGVGANSPALLELSTADIPADVFDGWLEFFNRTRGQPDGINIPQLIHRLRQRWKPPLPPPRPEDRHAELKRIYEGIIQT